MILIGGVLTSESILTCRAVQGLKSRSLKALSSLCLVFSSCAPQYCGPSHGEGSDTSMRDGLPTSLFPQKSPLMAKNNSEDVDAYDQCVAQGGRILKSYPPQCVDRNGVVHVKKLEVLKDHTSSSLFDTSSEDTSRGHENSDRSGSSVFDKTLLSEEKQKE
jgi:hypothetical protein